MANSSPGIIGTLDSIILLRAEILSPIVSIASDEGPIHINPDSLTSLAKFALSDKKPYPG